MLLESLRLHRRLKREWTRLAAQYQGASQELTSTAAWEGTFGGDAQ
jgi:galactofuranosylgalactofuranosylrhamnosyl-N-acetylglucosaminyl-diphospho-decaprenol beta-1,5/1,6-galactofuranosyltransferase